MASKFLDSPGITHLWEQIKALIGGKVDKVSSSTDNAVVRFDGTAGAVQNSGVTIDDSNNVSTAGDVKVKGLIVHGSNTSNDTRLWTSSDASNMYAKIGEISPLVVNSTEVRRGVSGTSINLGSSTYPWNNAYAKKWITNGGTSSQFVKGDGSLDSTSYWKNGGGIGSRVSSLSEAPTYTQSVGNKGTSEWLSGLKVKDGVGDYFYCAHRNSKYTITSNYKSGSSTVGEYTEADVKAFFTNSLSDTFTLYVANLEATPWVLTIQTKNIGQSYTITATDVLNLCFWQHVGSNYGYLNSYKIEVLTNKLTEPSVWEWHTVYQRTNVTDRLNGMQIPVWYNDGIHGTASGTYGYICGVRITVSKADATGSYSTGYLPISGIRLLDKRPSHTPANSIGAIDKIGGTMYGTLKFDYGELIPLHTYPQANNTYNLGTITNNWANVYAYKFVTKNGTSSQFVKGDGSLDSNTYAGAQTSGGAANKAVSIPFGQVDSTSTSTAFTATVDGITELRDGVCVYLKNGVVTSAANCTLNVNGLGAKPMYNTMAATTAISTQWNVNYTMLFIYNSTRVSGGCWDMYYGYNSDNNTRGYEISEYYSGGKKVKTACQRCQIMLTCMDGMLLPVYSGAYSNGTSKTLTTEKFNPLGQIYYYNSTTNLSAGASPANGVLFTQAAFTTVDIRYSFNTGSTLTVGNDIYLVCVPQDDGSAVLHTSPIAFSLPSTEDGLIYKRLGKANSTYTITLEQDKPCYYYKNGSINLWTGTGTQTDVSKSTESNVIDVGEYDLMKINEVKGKSLVMNQRVKNPNPSTTNNTEWRAYNNSNVSIEYVDDGVKATILNAGLGYLRGIVANSTGIANTHKILAIITIKPSVTHDFSFETGNATSTITSCTANQWTKFADIITSTKNDTQLIVKPATSSLSVNDTFTVRFASCIDLTQMFGAGNEPTTVEEVEAILGNDYYEYNTGEVVGNSVEKLDVTGFNIWDEEWEAGTLNPNTGLPEASQSTTHIRSKNYNLIIPNCTYFGYRSGLTGRYTLYVAYYDSNKNFISSGSVCNITFTSPVNAKYFKLWTAQVDYGNTYNNDICINKSNTSKNGTYEPYKHSEFPLSLTELTGKVNGEGTSVTIFPDGLHGVGTVYDSLIVDGDGYARKAIKRMGSVDLGSFSYTKTTTGNSNSRFVSGLFSSVNCPNAKSTNSSGAKINAICSRYSFLSSDSIYTEHEGVSILSSGNQMSIYIDAFKSSTDTAAFKTAVDGVMLYYELATPIEYVLDTPVQCVAKVYSNGTVKQVPVMPDSTPMVMDVTYLRDNGGFIGGLIGNYATKEYVDNSVEDKAPLSSPALTGIPTAPTAASGTNTTQIATTAFVQSALPTVPATYTLSLNATKPEGWYRVAKLGKNFSGVIALAGQYYSAAPSVATFAIAARQTSTASDIIQLGGNANGNIDKIRLVVDDNSIFYLDIYKATSGNIGNVYVSFNGVFDLEDLVTNTVLSEVSSSYIKKTFEIQTITNTTYQTTSNLVTSISSSSTDTQYPSAKCVYDLVGNIETLLASI